MTKSQKVMAEVPGRAEVKPRPVKLTNPEQIPEKWLGKSIVQSHFFNALSTMFPIGEEGFVRSVEYFKDRIKDPYLKRQIKGFRAQEKSHAHIHRLLNNDLEGRGYNIKKMDRIQQERIDFGFRAAGPYFMLATTVAAEHITAVLGEKWLKGEWALDGVDHQMKKVWDWHAVEELDHKSVAFDVYQQVHGGWWLRNRAMFYVQTIFWFQAISRTMYFLKRDGILYRWSTLKEALHYLYTRKWSYLSMLGSFLAFLSPNFHPDNTDDYPLVSAYDKGEAV